jgi:hypothetical protein
MVHYFFNSSGEWIAFRKDKWLFDTKGTWVGWFPWGDADAVDTQGNYLGTIVNKNRLYQFSGHPYRGYPGYPGYPATRAIPGILATQVTHHVLRARGTSRLDKGRSACHIDSKSIIHRNRSMMLY